MIVCVILTCMYLLVLMIHIFWKFLGIKESIFVRNITVRGLM